MAWVTPELVEGDNYGGGGGVKISANGGIPTVPPQQGKLYSLFFTIISEYKETIFHMLY